MNKELGIFLTWGRPGMGKSLDMARTALKLFKQYEKIEKKYPDLPPRALWTNQKFNHTIEEKYLHKKLFYWENPRQLKDLRHVDILWDEVGKDLPADQWSQTPKWLRQIFSHYRKRGLRLILNTQDYKGCDINLRRMIKKAYRVKKIFGNRDISVTLPQVKRIWGLIHKQEFDPVGVEALGSDLSDDDSNVTGKSTYFFIRRKYVELYDTTQEIPSYMPDKLEHIVQSCDICGKKISHRPI